MHVFQQRRQVRQLRAAQGQRMQVAPIGRAVHRAGDKALHVADLAQAADELAPQDVVEPQNFCFRTQSAAVERTIASQPRLLQPPWL